jgi:hypothetical protein
MGMRTERTIRRVESGDTGVCRCGLRRAYIALVTSARENRFGLLRPVTMHRSLCTQHAKSYAAQFHLEMPK